MDHSWVSILPPLVAIVTAVWSKKILPSLFLGLLVGSYILRPTLIGGLEASIENLVKILADKNNLQVLMFLYLFSGLICLIRKAGGITAFSNWAERRIQTKNGVFYALWALVPITFIDCAFRIVGAGSVVRPLIAKNKISNERFAFMLNNTASPVVELIPIATTFVGFNIANIGQGLKAAGVQEKYSAYKTLLHAIPFEFFSIAILAITFVSIFVEIKNPFAKAVRKPDKDSTDVMNMPMQEDKPEIKPRLFNLSVPMITVVLLSFFFFWYFGSQSIDSEKTISSIIAATDPNKAMLAALFISIGITGSLYFLQKYSVKKMTADLISGGNELMGILAILIVAWALGAVSQELHLSEFIRLQLGSTLPQWTIPASIFILASAVSYFIGEGWAAASLIMPLAISLAVTSNVGIPICVAAVITGGTFGDVTSPVAGMTNMSSSIAHADYGAYLKYALPYNLMALAIATTLFLIFGSI